MTSVDSLRLVSYNCRGWNSGQHAVCDSLQSCDVCLIQEHWLLHEQLSLLNVNNDFLSCGVSGMDSSDLLGRPFGGCAIFRRSLLPFVSCLDSPSKRFCSFLLRDRHGTSTLLICVYLPHNDGSSASHNEYLITLSELEGFINCHTSDHILIAGDFNAAFYHASMTLQHLRNFMTDLNLVFADLPFHSSICFTYMRDDGSASSWLDHFICDTSLAPDLSLFRHLDFGSNHSPLACSLQVDLSVTPPSSAPMQSTKSRIAWHAANSDLIRSYCDLVSHHLPSFPNSNCDCCDPFTLLHLTGFVNNSHCAFISVHCQPYPQYVTLTLSQYVTLTLEYCCFVCTRRRLTFGMLSGSSLDPLPLVFFIRLKSSPDRDISMK